MDFIKEFQLKIIEIVNGTDFFFYFFILYNLKVYIMTIKMKYLKDYNILKHAIKVKD